MLNINFWSNSLVVFIQKDEKVKIADEKLSSDRNIWSMKRTEHTESTFRSF